MPNINASNYVPRIVPSKHANIHMRKSTNYTDLQKRLCRQLLAGIQFGPVCEVILTIREQVPTSHNRVTKEEIMRCTRCAGLRVPDIIYEGGTRVRALRCVHCGDVIDAVIVWNRQRRRLPYSDRTRTPSTEATDGKKHTPTLV